MTTKTKYQPKVTTLTLLAEHLGEFHLDIKAHYDPDEDGHDEEADREDRASGLLPYIVVLHGFMVINGKRREERAYIHDFWLKGDGSPLGHAEILEQAPTLSGELTVKIMALLDGLSVIAKSHDQPKEQFRLAHMKLLLDTYLSGVRETNLQRNGDPRYGLTPDQRSKAEVLAAKWSRALDGDSEDPELEAAGEMAEFLKELAKE